MYERNRKKTDHTCILSDILGQAKLHANNNNVTQNVSALKFYYIIFQRGSSRRYTQI